VTKLINLIPSIPFYSQLHVHTQYFILDGVTNILSLIEQAKSLGMETAAITDYGNMFGVKEFHYTVTKKEIKPIIGCEIYVAKRSVADVAVKEDRSGDLLIF
jgi:DNA polymerase-3 subunit alpha